MNRPLLGALRGALAGAAFAELALRANDIHVADRLEVLVAASSFGAAAAATLEALPARALGARAAAGALASLAGIAALSLALRLRAGHFPWDPTWPPSSFLLTDCDLGPLRYVLVVGIAFASGQVAAGPRRESLLRALVASSTTALFLGPPLLVWGVAFVWAHALACVPLVLVAHGVTTCAIARSPRTSSSSSSLSCP